MGLSDKFDYLMAGLVGINAQVQMSGRIGGNDFDYIAAGHSRQGLLQASQG